VLIQNRVLIILFVHLIGLIIFYSVSFLWVAIKSINIGPRVKNLASFVAWMGHIWGRQLNRNPFLNGVSQIHRKKEWNSGLFYGLWYQPVATTNYNIQFCDGSKYQGSNWARVSVLFGWERAFVVMRLFDTISDWHPFHPINFRIKTENFT
jgi:hypothetical protein